MWLYASAMLAACAAPLKNRPSSDQTHMMQALMQQAVADNEGYGGGVLRMISAQGDVLWEGAAGNARGPGGPPMTANATFDIASITKTFTATIIMQLVEQGRLTLDDAVTAHLPPAVTEGLLMHEGRDITASIKLEHLLRHESGLPDYWTDPPFVEHGSNAFLQAFLVDPNRIWQPAEAIRYARALTPVGRPGDKFHYCDTGFVLLGMIIENLTGQSLATVYQQRIFTPLGMQDTFLPFVPPNTDRRPAADRFEGDAAISAEPRQSADWAGGGLVSSTRDLARFAVGLWHGRLFRHPDTLARMQAFRPTGGTDMAYGFGLFQITIGDGQGTLWGHDGHGNSFMYIWPEGNVAFVGTLNQVESDWWPLVWQMIQVVVGKQAGKS